jgi:hypothetical protein
MCVSRSDAGIDRKTHQLENVVTIANPINTEEIYEKSNEEDRFHLIIVSLLDSLKTR